MNQESQLAGVAPSESVLKKWDRHFDRVALFLSVIWLLVLVLELVGENSSWVFGLGTMLWLIFLAHYLLKVWISPNRLKFLAGNFLFGLALVIPLLRLFQVQREVPWVGYLTATSGAQLVWIFGSINFGMSSLRRAFQKRGIAVVGALSTIVVLVGAAALYHFENPVAGPGLHSYAESLWWTAMQMTTIGSGYSPVTPQGQVVALAISIFACCVLGYLTAALATFFVGQDAASPQVKAPTQSSIDALRSEIAALREEIRAIRKP